jgi:hypothetical protein
MTKRHIETMAQHLRVKQIRPIVIDKQLAALALAPGRAARFMSTPMRRAGLLRALSGATSSPCHQQA